jgi:hypothetical protein
VLQAPAQAVQPALAYHNRRKTTLELINGRYINVILMHRFPLTVIILELLCVFVMMKDDLFLQKQCGIHM